MHTLAISVLLASGAHAAPIAWTHLGHDQTRIARVNADPVDITSPTWIAGTDMNGQPIVFVGPSSPVVYGSNVYALGRSNNIERIYCFDRVTGDVRWQRDIAPAQGESWSSPAIDRLRNTVIASSGNQLAAFDLHDGTTRWSSTFARTFVNVSPLVTDDRGPRDRCFITDYSGFGVGASLHCVNVSPFDALLNPYQPGQIVWSTSLNNRGSSGNSCAYDGSRVYVANSGRFSPPLPGQIMAFDAGATTAPLPSWITTNPVNEGFYGGVAVEDGIVHAASYAFYAGTQSATILRLNSATGAIEWCSQSNRTGSIPIPFELQGSPYIALSTGLPGASFGSRPALELFDASGAPPCTDRLLWETSSATWIDDGDAVIEDGEFNIIGGWTHHPVIIETSAGDTLMYVGAIPSSPTATADDPYESLYLVDLSRTPTPDNSSGFVLQHSIGCGSSPAIAGNNLYCIGAAGLYAFGPPPGAGGHELDETITQDDAHRTNHDHQFRVATPTRP